MPSYIAVDLGASSGRVVNVRIEAERVELELVARFENRPIPGADGSIVWDTDALLSSLSAGLLEAADRSTPRSVAIDSWAVDYGFLDGFGHRLGPVHSYRSSRFDGVMEDVCARLGRDRIYGVTGIQFLPFNTAYQLVAARDTADYRAAAGLLMVPDLLTHELCGSTSNDVTNASTTQLLNAATREWADDLIGDLGLRRDLFPELHEPGTFLGEIHGLGSPIDGTAVSAVASHDTASAVVGTPLRTDRPGVYISSGTWSLVGCELSAPVTTPAALAANVSNELGFGGTTRLLKNVTGLWLLEEARRAWSAQGIATGVVDLVGAASALPGGRSVIDPDDQRFAAPGLMPERIASACRDSGQPVPRTPAEFTRVILDSLALAWRRAVATIERIGGVEAEVVHLVGGGSANVLLAQLCASACMRPVLAGPSEATVVGNALVQAIADGVVTDLTHGRDLVERALPLRRIDPVRTLDWDALDGRLAPGGAR